MKPKLFYPIKPFIVSQTFGEDYAFYKKQFGVNGHNGLDIRAPHGTPVYASHDGYAYYGIDPSGGHGVVINGDGFKTIYWHFVNSTLEPKYRSPIEDGPRTVKAGDLLGYADNTGVSTGSHLHYGFKFVDENGNTLNTNNGFLGAIDPTQYFVGYVEDSIKKYNFATNLSVGSRGNAVRYLQQFLFDKGYLPENCITGFYGPLTRNAVYKCQIDYQMPLGADWLYLGFYFGNKTRSFLNKVFT